MSKPFSYEEAAAPQTGSFSYEDATGEAPKPAGMLRKVADKGLGFASGAVGATKAIADAAGAGNAVSGALGSANEVINDYLSPEAKADQQEQSAIMDGAKDKGIWEGVKAGARAFGVAPVQTAVQGLGSIVPVLAGGLAGLPGAVATGVAMGAGTAKGAIYDEIKKRGGTEEEATQAQAYDGKNTDQIALGGALGAADAMTGVSRIAGGMVRGAFGKPVTKAVATGAERGVLGRAGMGMLGEMPLEAAQGGQEQVAANLAAQRAGYEAGTWDNVASNATLEALASAGPGSVFGALDRQAPAQQPTNTPEQAPPANTPPTPLQIGNTPDPLISFADGTVAHQSEVDKYISGLPPEQQPAARAKLMGMAPQPAKPSEAMGLAPTATPSLTNAAILAVDSGVSQPAIGQIPVESDADPVKSAQDEYRAQTAAMLQQQDEQAYKAYMDAITQAGEAKDEAPGETVAAVVPIANVLADFDHLSDDEFFAQLGATPEEIQDAIASQPSSPQASDENSVGAAPDVAVSTDEGTQPVSTKQANLDRIRAASRPQPTTLGTKTNAVAGPGFGINAAQGMSNVKDATQGTDTQATQAPGEAPKTVASNAAASSELPTEGSGVGTVEGGGVKAGDYIKPTIGADTRARQVESVGPDGWVYTKSGEAFKPDQVELTEKPQPKESGGFGIYPGERNSTHQENVARWNAGLTKQPAQPGTTGEGAGVSQPTQTASTKKEQAKADLDHLFGIDNKRAKAIERIAKGTAYFSKPLKAQEFIAKNGLKDTHQAVKTGAKRWDIVAKDSQPTESKLEKAPEAKQTSSEQPAQGATVATDKPAADAGVAAAGEAEVAKPVTPEVEPKARAGKSRPTVNEVARSIQLKVAQNRLKHRQKLRKEREAKGYAPNSTAESEQADYEKEISAAPMQMQLDSASRLIGSDPEALIGMFVNGNYEASEDVFKEITGVKIRGLSAADKKAALYKWANWTPEQIAEAEARADAKQSDRQEKSKQKDLEYEVRGAWAGLGRLQVKDKDGKVMTGQEFVLDMASKGFNQTHTHKKGIATVYSLTDGARSTSLKNKDFNAFVKAAIGMGGLENALNHVKPDWKPVSQVTEPSEVTHNGTRLYKTKVKLSGEVVDKWAVESQDNKRKKAAGERAIGGDSLHDTLDAAKKAADFEAKQDEQAQARKAEIAAQEKEAQAKKDANKGKSIVERRKQSVLDSPTKFPPQAGLGTGTKRESMQKAVDQERAIVVKMVDDTAAKKRDNEAIDLVRARGFILGLSNENIPVVKAALEAQARLKTNDYKKPSYRVYAGRDTDGSFYEITKTEYDYAQELKEKPAAPPVSKTETTERFAIGKSLTKEQRKKVLDTLVDVYKSKGAPKESKGQGRDGEERFGYAYSPDLFEKSDITGAMVRYHVTLPDGKLAHPSELFEGYTQSDIDAELERRANAEKRNKQVARDQYLAPSVQFDTKREAAVYWNDRSDKSTKTAQGKPTIFDAMDREHLTDGKKFVMVPRDLLANAEMMDAIRGEGWDVPTAKAEQPAQPAGKYQGPSDVSTRAGQMELANRAGRIASLKAMNGQLRQIAPNEAWADANIESANDLDALQDQISTALVAAQKGTPATAKAPDALRATLDGMDGKELTAVFNAMNLTGKHLTYDEKIDALMAEDADEVRAAIAKAQPAAQEPAKPAGKIEDSGEVLEGARKLYAKSYAAKMDEGMGMDTAAVPLSKSWPEPDYQRLLDEGADPWAVAMAHAMRDEIPTKPSTAWKVKGWTGKVEILRGMAADAISGKLTRDRISTKAETHGLHGWLHKIDLYQAVGHAKSLKGMTFGLHEYGMYGGQTFSPAKKLWVINVPSASGSTWKNGNWGNDLVVADTKEEAIEKFKAWHAAQGEAAPTEAKATSFDIYSYRSKPNVFIVGKRLGSTKSIDLKEFPTAKEARAYIAANQAELERLLSEAKFEPTERREENLPRVGADHRNGADVTSEQFRETFGFRGEQFGASMPQAERQANMNQAYDALMDLAGVIGVPPKSLSLNGELGLAFGARGTGGKNAAAAHYERDTTGEVTPNRVVINLTRKNGAGSLAHEWFHAVDNYFARMRGEKGGMLTEKPYERGEGVRPEMLAAFKQLMATINLSGIKERSKNLDKKRVNDYWSTGLEMAARSFESYVIAKLQDKDGANDYLANIVPEELYAMQANYPYPVMGEMPAIRAAFDDFFKTVQTKETDKGVALFSQGLLSPASFGPKPTLDQIQRLVDKVLQVAKNVIPVSVIGNPSQISGIQVPTGAKPKGALIDGRIYLFTDNIQSIGDAYVTLFHELFHLGLQKVIPAEDYATMLRQFSRNVLVQKFVREWKASPEGVEKAATMPSAAYEALAAEEAMAMISEELSANDGIGARKMPGLVKTMLSWFAGVADRLGFPDNFGAWMRKLTQNDAEKFVTDMVRASMGGDKNLGKTQAKYGTQAAEMTVQKRLSAGNDNPDIRFSQGLGDTLSSAANNVRNVKLPADYVVGDFFNGAPGKLGIWFKTVGTQYHLAQKSPAFKRVFDSVQTFLNDVSYYATEAADLAPSILPKLETWKDIAKSPISATDTKAFSAPVFEGTLNWARDESGKAVKQEVIEAAAAKLTVDQKSQRLLRGGHISEQVLKMWRGLPVDQYESLIESKFERDMMKAGIVFTDAELKQHFSLTPDQIKLYREFRKATDKSLTNLAIADMLRFGGKDVEPIRETVMASKDVTEAANTLADYLRSLSELEPDRADVLIDSSNKMIDKGNKAQDLMSRGYAPLSRFGQYTLDVVGQDGERLYFGMFESKWEAAKMARTMKADHPTASITQGTVSKQAYKLFAGVSPETLALFGDMLGLEEQGDSASAQAFQEYLKLATSNRSAMKRLIQRKGIAGFNEDAGRVLAGFVYSNARQTSNSLHAGEMTNSVNDMPKQQGELKDAAVNLVDYIKNPQEEAQAIRGLLFTQYIGGSIASAMVNLTQPLTMTMPWLSQYGGAVSAAKTMASAVKDAYKPTTGDAKLDAAIKLAEEKGIVSPQEVHQLMKQAQGQAALRSGDGTKLGNAAATAQNTLSRFMMAWGKPFSWAEQMNRRVTFIAAYRTAIAQKMGDPMAFAEKAIEETQGIYNKANKPTWARGALGGTLFTFKQYSIAYVEMLQRMARNGPEGKKAALLALAVLFLLSGASGMPGADDLDDIISGAMQSMGYNFDSKQKRKEFFVSLLGEDGARFMERGVSGLPGVPIDVAGRMGLGNLIPGTGLFQKKPDHTRDIAEISGPAGDMVKRGYDASGKLLKGEVLGAHGAIATAAPKAMQNLSQAFDMASMGMYRDQNGKKVLDTGAGDALVKALGFQPNDVARVQGASFDVQRMIGINKMRETEIADQWAKGLFEKDMAKVQEARLELSEWNANNESSPIKIDMGQIFRRLKQMNMTKEERLAKTAPKEIRNTVRGELEKSR